MLQASLLGSRSSEHVVVLLEQIFFCPLQFRYREKGLCREEGRDGMALVSPAWRFVSLALPLGSWGVLWGCIPSFNRSLLSTELSAFC